MERNNRRTQIIAIIALVVSAVGISLGFAAFSNTLTIEPGAEVAPANFDVDFSTDGGTQVSNDKTIGKEGDVSGTPSKDTGVVKDATANDATITNTASGAPKITGIHANFTDPGQTVTYNFYSVNVGELDAFLREVNFANASGVNTYKKCTSRAAAGSEEAATQSLVDAACNDISLSVSVGGTSFNASSGSNTTISSHSLAVGANETVTVTITYAKTGTNGNRVDGDVDVTFGDVTLVYKSFDAS